MMMKRLFRLALLCVAGVGLMTLAGCGQQTNAAKADKVAFVATAQNKQQQIWYLLNTAEPESNSLVRQLFVVQSGKMQTYQLKNVSLKSLQTKSVAKQIAVARSNERGQFKRAVAAKKSQYRGALATDKVDQKNAKQDQWQKGIDQINDQLKQDQRLSDQFEKSTKNLTYSLPTAYTLHAVVHKNHSGKQVIGETLRLKMNPWQYGTTKDGTVSRKKVSRSYELTEDELMAAPVKVGNARLIGFYSNSGAMVTRTTNHKAKSNFDTPTVKGVD